MCESSPLHKIGLKMSYRCPVGNLPGKGGIPPGGDGVVPHPRLLAVVGHGAAWWHTGHARLASSSPPTGLPAAAFASAGAARGILGVLPDGGKRK